jgi:hypothetical protein
MANFAGPMIDIFNNGQHTFNTAEILFFDPAFTCFFLISLLDLLSWNLVFR